MFPLPKRAKLRHSWLKWIRKIHGPDFIPHVDYVVCEKHFVSGFLSKIIFSNGKENREVTRWLWDEAVPTIYHLHQLNSYNGGDSKDFGKMHPLKEETAAAIEASEDVFVADGICSNNRSETQVSSRNSAFASTSSVDRVLPFMICKKARVVLKRLNISKNFWKFRNISHGIVKTGCSVHGCWPYCKAYERIGVFHLPEAYHRSLWIRWIQSIHGNDFIPSKDFVVCERHFISRFVIREETLPCADGTNIKVRRYKPMLLQNAVPTIHPKTE